MTNYLTKLALLVALGAGVALAQAYPQQQEQKPSEPTAPQTQQQPAPEQTQPQEQKEQMPQAETAPSTTDVQSNIQAALQKEPTLASANIQVNVTNKAVELSGTVTSSEEKKTAEQIAKSNAAGRKVKNHIKVSAAAPAEPPK